MVKKVKDGIVCVCEDCRTEVRIKSENLDNLVEIVCPLCGVVLSTLVKKKEKKSKIAFNKSYEYLELYNMGMSVNEIAKKLKVKNLTVRDNLLRLYTLGFIDVVDFISVGEENRVIIEKAIEEVGFRLLKPIKEVCPEYITYDEIALIVADWNKTRGIKGKMRKYEIQEKLGSSGTCFGIKEFIRDVRSGNILDEDGIGYYHNGYEETKERVMFNGNSIVGEYSDYLYVCWYNK